MTHRFVVLGLAGSRAPWFAAIGQWAHTGSIPVDFIKCVSAEQLHTRLRSGRVHSAALLDGALPGVDRDLIDAAHHAGTAVIVIGGSRDAGQWTALGADVVLSAAVDPMALTDALHAHAAMVPTGEWRLDSTDVQAVRETGRLVALCGPGGTGVSTLAIALAQQLGDSHEADKVVLADLRLRGEQAMLHDAAEVGPGIQELVGLCRIGSPDHEQVLSHAFAVGERSYALVLGLRQPTAWSTLRPRAVAVAIRALRQAFAVVVCDCDRDLEGQADGGSLDVEERNALSRGALLNADVVFAIGRPGLKGVYSLATLANELVDAGISSQRVIPVFNRADRSPRARARASTAFAGLLSATARSAMPSALFVADRDVEASLCDRRRLPSPLGDPLVGALGAMKRAEDEPRAATPDVAVRQVKPGELGAWAEEVGAS